MNFASEWNPLASKDTEPLQLMTAAFGTNVLMSLNLISLIYKKECDKSIITQLLKSTNLYLNAQEIVKCYSHLF